MAAMESPLRVGMIGTGVMGLEHIRNLKLIDVRPAAALALFLNLTLDTSTTSDPHTCASTRSLLT